jgi:hypothetical protein
VVARPLFTRDTRFRAGDGGIGKSILAAETIDQVDRLPRGRCPVCRRSVPVRHNGAAREHWAPIAASNLGGLRQASDTPKCPGSGAQVLPDDPETIAAAATIVSPGHCSDHPDHELVTHKQAGVRRWGEDPATVCPSREHDVDLDGRERCRWCGDRLIPPGTPSWATSQRRAYCKPHHRLLAFRARQAAAS